VQLWECLKLKHVFVSWYVSYLTSTLDPVFQIGASRKRAKHLYKIRTRRNARATARKTKMVSMFLLLKEVVIDQRNVALMFLLWRRVISQRVNEKLAVVRFLAARTTARKRQVFLFWQRFMIEWLNVHLRFRAKMLAQHAMQALKEASHYCFWDENSRALMSKVFEVWNVNKLPKLIHSCADEDQPPELIDSSADEDQLHQNFVEINVLLLNGKRLALKMAASDTILAMKNKIYFHTEIVEYDQLCVMLTVIWKIQKLCLIMV
jgi:hypothetical protein